MNEQYDEEVEVEDNAVLLNESEIPKITEE